MPGAMLDAAAGQQPEAGQGTTGAGGELSTAGWLPLAGGGAGAEQRKARDWGRASSDSSRWECWDKLLR